jgi:hypothetical protein
MSEFFKRWGEGIRNITPFQSARITYFNTWIMVLGIILGLIFTFDKVWWLFIILIAALVNTLIVQAGNYQKYKLLKGIKEGLNTNGTIEI